MFFSLVVCLKIISCASSVGLFMSTKKKILRNTNATLATICLILRTTIEFLMKTAVQKSLTAFNTNCENGNLIMHIQGSKFQCQHCDSQMLIQSPFKYHIQRHTRGYTKKLENYDNLHIFCFETMCIFNLVVKRN